MSRIFTLSDIHVDFPANMDYMLGLSNFDYQDDVLIIPGDISDNLAKIEKVLANLRHKFRRVTYVPGNHELWVRKKEAGNSIEKFEAIINLCDRLDIDTRPFSVFPNQQKIWIIPLFSWYRSEENDPHSLYIPKQQEDLENNPWMDNFLCRWPDTNRKTADYFTRLNQPYLEAMYYDGPIITFSHMLPRRDLIFGSMEMARRYGDGREPLPPFPGDPVPEFNFSRVAGCAQIDMQLRRVKAKFHIYGHQHRDRNRLIDGVTYISHCLGYPRDRNKIGHSKQPLPIYQNQKFISPKEEM